jgi:phosphoglycerate dehydrogenase-like enzyme
MLGPYDGEIQPSHKRALLEQSDVVVCSLPGTPATRHFLSTAEFGAMKDDAIFISLGCAALFLAGHEWHLRRLRLRHHRRPHHHRRPAPSHSRGIVVDEAALHATLAAGRLRGAALDVFEVEPLPSASPLWDSERLLLTAHNADFTDDYFAQGWRVWAENLDRFEAGQPLATPVDKRAGY